nr:MAG TPA: hypothetical protein [Caudoviricetes sp.]
MLLLYSSLLSLSRLFTRVLRILFNTFCTRYVRLYV